MLIRKLIYVLIFILSTVTLSSCKSNSKLVDSTTTINSKASLKKPYLILISLDGFRWDYVDKYTPPNITNFIKKGIKAESLISCFPSKTFPNHYSIATGMYPDKHNIIGNSFYSDKKNTIYSISNRETVTDGSFYEGTPIWVQAEKENMVTASYFFVGSEADIQGIKPTYYRDYNGKIKNETRVTQVLNWLTLPEEKRPHLITMYFSDMDDTGHKYGPNNDEELKKSLINLDKNLGNLFKGVQKTGLPVNIIIVSDHGMEELQTSKLIPIELIKNDSLFLTVNNGSFVNIYPKKGVETDFIYNSLKHKETHFKVYKTENAPGFEYIPKNKNWGSILLIPDLHYYFSEKKHIASLTENKITAIGVHGRDPKQKDMHGILYAKGPAFKEGYVTPSVKNIHIYPLICKILGLTIPETIDGDLSQLQPVLK
ncbi:alkaline phosphatase family protein [Aureibaculum marinum]|uniref:alkaline phosphatase family protein n=1 Tax=Aureibaculum marinum TaxID=2487930 RepID=UPI001EF05C74|nr:ectonucleotide pyrophosphatase/phosphodiesterase [Aureibaculum marinum]